MIELIEEGTKFVIDSYIDLEEGAFTKGGIIAQQMTVEVKRAPRGTRYVEATAPVPLMSGYAKRAKFAMATGPHVAVVCSPGFGSGFAGGFRSKGGIEYEICKSLLVSPEIVIPLLMNDSQLGRWCSLHGAHKGLQTLPPELTRVDSMQLFRMESTFADYIKALARDVELDRRFAVGDEFDAALDAAPSSVYPEDLSVNWIPEGAAFIVSEYDGSERVIPTDAISYRIP